ncbi:MAG: HlyD family efflux transporter periplasmic adaptor subunit [Stigonema ocellatum SAG 48.90 = DSM 106950]|nr:HlyD family efflux transporter periplasmic adaptor subunit [Stigonema ocellatum SAG 48.90 = DSM 106950]
MHRIIRSNAVETSNQSNISGINVNLTPEMALIYGGSVADRTEALTEAPTKTHIATVTTSKTAIKNTGNWSTSLQTLLHQPPSILPYLVLLGSVAFFATVVVWAWTGKIEEVGHLRGKFLPIGELHQQQVQNLDVVSSLNIHRAFKVAKQRQTIAEIAPQDVPLILVATLSHQEVGFVNKEDKVQIKLDADPDGNQGFISGRVISIFPYPQTDDKLGLIYRVELALDDNYVTRKKQILKLKVGQTATAKIIHKRRMADIFLEPLKQWQ